MIFSDSFYVTTIIFIAISIPFGLLAYYLAEKLRYDQFKKDMEKYEKEKKDR